MHTTDKNILFMGTSEFASGILDDLLGQGITIKAAITQPDKKAGRKQMLTPSPVKELATKKGVAIKQYEKIDAVAISDIKKLNPDLIIVAAYGIILPKELLHLPKFGCINIHGSLLPKHRGASPIQTSLRNGDETTGTTIILMDEGVDTGPILSHDEVEVFPDDDFFDLQGKLIHSSNKILIPTIEKYFKGELTPEPQDNSKATHTRLIKKEDGLIDWGMDARSIFNRFRAFKSWPLVYTYFDDNDKTKKLILNDIEVDETRISLRPGEVAKEEEKFLVGTGSKSISIKKLTLEGSKETGPKSFVNGKPHFIKTVLFSKKI